MTSKRFGFLLLWATLALSLGVSGCVVPTPVLAHERDVIDVDVFYQPLAPFGSWIVLEDYGQVWIPHHLRAGWRPYTDGRWVYTEDGWMWIAEEEWGWAPFHYGRWSYTTHYGWFWVPDVVWAPAWVSWQYAPGWIGWAPLPPTAVFRADVGLGLVHIDIAPNHFCFVEERWMLAPRVVHYIAPPTRNMTLLHVTRNVTHYTVINNRVVNRGIAVERIERVTRRSVPRLRVVDIQDDRPERKTYVREREREVVVPRPSTLWNAAPSEGRPAPRPPAPPPRSNDRDKAATPPQRERLQPGPPEPTPGATAPSPPEPWRQPYKTERPPRRERVTPEQVAPQEPQRQDPRHPPGGTSRQERYERQSPQGQEWRDQPRQQRQPARPPQAEERQQGMPPQPYGGQPGPPPRPPQGASGRASGQPPQGVVPTPPPPPETAPPTDGRRRGAVNIGPPGSEPFPQKDR